MSWTEAQTVPAGTVLRFYIYKIYKKDALVMVRVIDILLCDWNDETGLEFYGIDGEYIGECPANQVPIILWNISIWEIKRTGKRVSITCEIGADCLQLMKDHTGKLYPYAYSFS